jgi:hypothetical protein
VAVAQMLARFAARFRLALLLGGAVVALVLWFSAKSFLIGFFSYVNITALQAVARIDGGEAHDYFAANDLGGLAWVYTHLQRGDPSVWLLASLAAGLLANTQAIWTLWLVELWAAVMRRVNRGAAVTVMLCFVCFCVARASADTSTEAQLLRRHQLPEVARLLTGDSRLVRSSISAAHAVSERMLGVSHVDFYSSDELVTLIPGANSSTMIWDSGSRRHVVCSRDELIPSSITPCPFRIRGIHSTGKHPDCMGDAPLAVPLDDGTVATFMRKGAVCIREAPHEVVSPGLFQRDGYCSWDGRLDDGRKVVLDSHDVLITLPRCAANQTTHQHVIDSVLSVQHGADRRTDAPLPEPADAALALPKASSSQPCVWFPNDPRLIPSPALQSPRSLMYWCSGVDRSADSVSAQWPAITGQVCIARDNRVSWEDSLLRNEVYESDVGRIKDGTINRGLFSPPCGTFCVSRFRPHPRLRAIRTSDHLHGIPGATPAELAQIRVSDLINERCCDAALELHVRGGLFALENPVWRNDSKGPWLRFNSGKFPLHGAIWQDGRVRTLARVTGAHVLHVPMCWFAHCSEDVCDDPQKFLTYMYSSRLEPALGFLRDTDCFHSRHGRLAVGFDADGASVGAATSKYYPEQNRIFVRAFAFPDRCASDASWTSLRASVSTPTRGIADTVLPVEHDCTGSKGLTGDRAAHEISRGQSVRGHALNLRRLTSRQVHETYLHKPVDMLRQMGQVCSDVPTEWANLRDLDLACPDCIAGKHTHFGSNSHLPEVTAPGEIVCFDLLILRTPDLYTGGVIVFAAIDLYSDWDLLCKIRYKTAVPDCLRELHRLARSFGVEIKRLHTDGEAVFHSDEVHKTLEAEFSGIGCLLTTGCDYDHRQNSKIERHLRRLADDARPGFLQSDLPDSYYQCALVDASSKHKLLPLRRLPGQSPLMLFTGKQGRALPYRPFGILAYVRLEHELNDSTSRLNKAHARAEPGILLSYGVTGEVHDRRQPGWAVHVPTWKQNRPAVSPHCTFVPGCYPGREGLRHGLDSVLRPRSDASGDELVTMEARGDGAVVEVPESLVPLAAAKAADDAGVAATPGTILGDNHQPAMQHVSPTIAQRLPRRAALAGHQFADTTHVRSTGALEFDDVAMCDDVVLSIEEVEKFVPPVRSVLPVVSFHPSQSLRADALPVAPDLRSAPWLATPRGGVDTSSDDYVLIADLDGVIEPEPVLLCSEEAVLSAELKSTITRVVTYEAPRRTVRFPWGDVPTPWISGYSTIYDTGIDDSVFILEDDVICTSLHDGDDPHWEQAVRGNDSQQWYKAADAEYDNLERFGVFQLVAADKVPSDEDIFDSMLVCKRKRGQNNDVLKFKVRCVLCGNQMVDSAKRGESKTTADMRTHSPAARSFSLKANFAVGVLHNLRQRDFDVDAAYLQGQYVDRRVFARPPAYYRRFDERGVELVWLLLRALYGGIDSGRLWYNTWAHHHLNETITPFQRCHFEPAAFTHICDHPEVVKETPTRIVLARPHTVKRILLITYVDDGRTWDNCADVTDAYYVRLQARFSLTLGMGGTDQFMLGMDIKLGDGWVKLYASTFIKGMCEKWLDAPISEYDQVYTPGHPKLMEYYEAALVLRGNTPPVRWPRNIVPSLEVYSSRALRPDRIASSWLGYMHVLWIARLPTS